MSRLILMNDQMDFVSFNLGGVNDPYYLLETAYYKPLTNKDSIYPETIPSIEGGLISIFPAASQGTTPLKIATLHTVDELQSAIDETNKTFNLRESKSLTERFNTYNEKVCEELSKYIARDQKLKSMSPSETLEAHTVHNRTNADVAKERLSKGKKVTLLTRRQNRV